MAEAAKAVARQLPAFKLGRKQVFLPDHVITLLRKEHLPPNEACFQVPLRFTKFDLRDYLWNLYNVEVRKVRAYVKQQPISRRPFMLQSYYRPQSIKIMNVELAKPFQWPEVPTNREPWSHDLWKMREERKDENKEESYNKNRFKMALISQKPLSEERQQLASLAKQMLSGEIKWKNDLVLDPKWDMLLPKDDKRAANDDTGHFASR
ncbi:hypothetical protein G6O67_000557 [Ophiocordyceps sinensis]|uniref:Large ribosomal subunit protein uL23m n=2 Tax=Ophiocordyceps sinensis TaxID=72228 RepID=A0A8H4PZ94_9HYPO|nr:Ribosomal protein L25/L23 [Ophiocordyceps sinensis CO18]KAF4513266.1 hypothetical protein G6O67_000557 [Ophiocordyceps sinensis]